MKKLLKKGIQSRFKNPKGFSIDWIQEIGYAIPYLLDLKRDRVYRIPSWIHRYNYSLDVRDLYISDVAEVMLEAHFPGNDGSLLMTLDQFWEYRAAH